MAFMFEKLEVCQKADSFAGRIGALPRSLPLASSLCALLLCWAGCASSAAPLHLGERPLRDRIAERSYPSVFMAWNRADNLKEDFWTTAARHDLIFAGPEFFGLQWNDTFPGLATGFTDESVALARERRKDLLKRNPNLVLLVEIRYRDAQRSWLPEGHRWWRRDGEGRIVNEWNEGGYLQMDFSNGEYRSQVARQAKAVVESGVADGVMLDWWTDDDDRLALVQCIRDRVGDKALILVNANDLTTPRTAAFINGYFMECYRTRTSEDWRRIAETLTWAEKNLRQPRINCLETWYHTSRNDEYLMRATTTLSLTLSDGYCLFSDPNPLPSPDHLHSWYPFWQRSLGRALSPGRRRDDGSYTREFDNGTVVYNPMGNAEVRVSFPEQRLSVASGKCSISHVVSPCDGDILLKNASLPQKKIFGPEKANRE